MKISLKGTFVMIGTMGIVSSFVVLFPLIPELSGRDSSVESTGTIIPKKQAILGIPIRLKIPTISVDTTIESVSITPQGEMDVAKGLSNVAWFELGPRPGAIGSAVIVGHYGVWKSGKPTVFNRLYTLRKGDKIYVEDKSGKMITFVVHELRTYSQDGDTTQVFGSSDGKSHLNLITCQGIWNKTKKSYPYRLVVFTDKEAK